jgi:hypothetical protein
VLYLIKVRKRLWDKTDLPPFGPQGDIAADCLKDLKIGDNKLSIWRIDDDQANLKRVVTALAANCDDASNIDYLLFDNDVIAQNNLKVQQSAGETLDQQANASWHWDLIELSARKVVDLALTIFYHDESKSHRLSQQYVLTLLRDAVASNHIDAARMKPKLKTKVTAAPA